MSWSNLSSWRIFCWSNESLAQYYQAKIQKIDTKMGKLGEEINALSTKKLSKLSLELIHASKKLNMLKEKITTTETSQMIPRGESKDSLALTDNTTISDGSTHPASSASKTPEEVIALCFAKNIQFLSESSSLNKKNSNTFFSCFSHKNIDLFSELSDVLAANISSPNISETVKNQASTAYNTFKSILIKITKQEKLTTEDKNAINSAVNTLVIISDILKKTNPKTLNQKSSISNALNHLVYEAKKYMQLKETETLEKELTNGTLKNIDDSLIQEIETFIFPPSTNQTHSNNEEPATQSKQEPKKAKITQTLINALSSSTSSITSLSNEQGMLLEKKKKVLTQNLEKIFQLSSQQAEYKAQRLLETTKNQKKGTTLEAANSDLEIINALNNCEFTQNELTEISEYNRKYQEALKQKESNLNNKNQILVYPEEHLNNLIEKKIKKLNDELEQIQRKMPQIENTSTQAIQLTPDQEKYSSFQSRYKNALNQPPDKIFQALTDLAKYFSSNKNSIAENPADDSDQSNQKLKALGLYLIETFDDFLNNTSPENLLKKEPNYAGLVLAQLQFAITCIDKKYCDILKISKLEKEYQKKATAVSEPVSEQILKRLNRITT